MEADAFVSRFLRLGVMQLSMIAAIQTGGSKYVHAEGTLHLK
jgi:hypothetical protein